ncbi:hypothetical protein [Brevundimonas naejangsanensis]|uniref:hypothetical protein n=1 Tax=Brevundimonas naejangsanensis TaxID=588932 RepID=UPI0003FB6EFF|nr:hypothetical protein [Brevundimonas naejangsanensis]
MLSFRILLGAVAPLSLLLATLAAPAEAQDSAPIPPAAETDEDAGQDVEVDAPASVAPLIGAERFLAEVLGMEPTGDPVVSDVTIKGQPFLTAPLRLKSEGRLGADIATASHRMAAGAPVVHREFKPRTVDQSESIQAWCGPGEQRGMFGWARGFTVCMVHTSDGKANLGTPVLAYGPWWTAREVSFTSVDARTERVEVVPAEAASAFNLTIVYERMRNDGLAIRAGIEGPGMTADAKPYRYTMRRRVLPLTDGVARMVYDGQLLQLTPQGAGDSIEINSERVAPPVDFNALLKQAENRAATAPAQTPGEARQTDDSRLAPTPFVIGGVRLKPEAMTAGQGVISRGGVVLSGPAEYALTGRLSRPLNLRAPLINDFAPEGMILHEVEFARTTPLGARTMTRIWCGPIGAPTIWSSKRVTMCLRRGQSTPLEAFWPSTGRPWLGTTMSSGAVGALPAYDFEIERSPSSLLEPLDVRAEIQRLTDAAVTLRIFARKGDEDALILVLSPEFKDGEAAIPLWSHRLLLTRSDAGVTARFSADGDGEGPTAQGVYP